MVCTSSLRATRITVNTVWILILQFGIVHSFQMQPPKSTTPNILISHLRFQPPQNYPRQARQRYSPYNTAMNAARLDPQSNTTLESKLQQSILLDPDTAAVQKKKDSTPQYKKKSTELKNVSDRVKKVTSDLVAPLAVDEDALGEYCTFITGDEECLLEGNETNDPVLDLINKQGNEEDNLRTVIDNSIKLLPFIIPLFAYMTYEQVTHLFELFVEFLSQNNWESVDGNAFQIQTITPAINGIVVPAVSILFATLSGTTISTLRQRQLDIRTCLNMEANEIRVLQAMVDTYPSYDSTAAVVNAVNPVNASPNMHDFQDKCRAYLIQYTARLITESQPGVSLSNIEFKGSIDSEMNGFIIQLNEMASLPPPSTSTPSSSPVTPNPIILSESYGAISRLNSHRSTRISALQSTFPMLHFLIVFALGSSICVAFLMETNQDILYFLNKVQLKLLWTILNGTLASLGVVCYDLLDPFRGSYQISSSIDQLHTIREVLRASNRLKQYKRLEENYMDKTPKVN